MSSPINKESLEHLASLARLKLDEEEKEKFLTDLGNILTYFDELKSLDTANVSPMTGGTELKGIFREDENLGSHNPGLGKNAFPEKKDDYLKVPPVFE